MRFSTDPSTRIGGVTVLPERPPLAGLRPARHIDFSMLSNY